VRGFVTENQSSKSKCLVPSIKVLRVTEILHGHVPNRQQMKPNAKQGI